MLRTIDVNLFKLSLSLLTISVRMRRRWNIIRLIIYRLISEKQCNDMFDWIVCWRFERRTKSLQKIKFHLLFIAPKCEAN